MDRGNTVRRTDMTKVTVALRNFANASKLLHYFSACNYTYLTNLIKLRVHCSIKNCFSKGFLITLGQRYIKQSSATQSKYLTQLHYANAQVTCRGPKTILHLLVEDENG
jgi:subtilase family serine protease